MLTKCSSWEAFPPTAWGTAAPSDVGGSYPTFWVCPTCTAQSTISQPQHYRCLGRTVLSCGDYAEPCRVFSTIPGLYLLLRMWVALSRHDNQNVCNMTNVPRGDNHSWFRATVLESQVAFWKPLPGFLSAQMVGCLSFWDLGCFGGDFEKAMDFYPPPRRPLSHTDASGHPCTVVTVSG